MNEMTTDHPSAETLAAFLDGGLADAERRAVVAHLADCERCREVAVGVVEFERQEAIAGHSGATAGEAKQGDDPPLPFAGLGEQPRGGAGGTGGSHPATAVATVVAEPAPRSAPPSSEPSRLPLWIGLAAAALLVAALGLPWILPPPPLDSGHLVADLPLTPELTEALWGPPVLRSGGDSDSTSLERSFRLGVELVQARWALVAGEPDAAEEKLRELARIIAGDLPETSDAFSTAADEVKEAQTVPADLPTRFESLEAEIDESFSEIPELYYGKWVAAGRLATEAGEPDFFKRSYRRTGSRLLAREEKGLEGEPYVIEDPTQREAMQAILDAIAKPKATELPTLTGHYETLLRHSYPGGPKGPPPTSPP